MTKAAIQALWDAINELRSEVAKLKRSVAKLEAEKKRKP